MGLVVIGVGLWSEGLSAVLKSQHSATMENIELRRGSQPSPWVGPGKPNLPLGLRGKIGRAHV